MNRSSKSRRRALLIALVGVALVAAAVVVILGQVQGTSDALRGAGAEARIAPLGPVQLIAAMDPLEDGRPEADALPAVDPATVPDTKIRVDVEMKLHEMNLPTDRLDIRVDDRTVFLEGRVDDTLMRDAIEVTARSVPGVRQVNNRIEVVGQ